jgi:nitroreductase
MTFEEYFKLDGLPRERQYVHWFLGLAPKGIHRRYLVEPSRMNIRGRRGPSIGAACMLCAGVVGVEALKLLLGRGKVYAAPHFHQCDPFAERFVRGTLWGGNRHPLQRLKIAMAMKLIGPLAEGARPPEAAPPDTTLMRILDAARWTPSADNSQPWRFAVVDGAVTLHVSGDKSKTLSVRNDEIDLLSAGMMLEIMTIAATKEGKPLSWRYLPPQDAKCPDHRFAIALGDGGVPAPDPLYPFITLRHTDRRHYRTTPLTDAQKRTLAEALGDALTVHWMEGPRRRMVARLNMQAFAIRMKSETAYHELAACLDWYRPFPKEKLPVLSLPITAPSRRIMRWAMASWARMKTLAMIPGALLPSAIETELFPALRCGAHIMLIRPSPLPTEMVKRAAAIVAEGRAVMRFWLTATRLGLAMQPSFAPLVFSHYGTHPEHLPPHDRHLAGRCGTLAKRLEEVWQTDPRRLIFMGRVGTPRSTAVTTRSLRKNLNDLVA